MLLFGSRGRLFESTEEDCQEFSFFLLRVLDSFPETPVA